MLTLLQEHFKAIYFFSILKIRTIFFLCQVFFKKAIEAFKSTELLLLVNIYFCQ